MTRPAYAALAVALGFAGVISWECLDRSPAQVPPPPPWLAVEGAGSRPEAPEARRRHVEARAATVLARPLFSRTRRPQEPEAGATPDRPPLRLAGTLVSQTGRQAILVSATDGKALAAGVGSRVGVFTVTAITAGEVTVLDPDKATQVLRLRADPAVRTAAAPAVPAVPPAGMAQAAPSSVLKLLQSIPGEDAKLSPDETCARGRLRLCSARSF